MDRAAGIWPAAKESTDRQSNTMAWFRYLLNLSADNMGGITESIIPGVWVRFIVSIFLKYGGCANSLASFSIKAWELSTCNLGLCARSSPMVVQIRSVISKPHTEPAP